MWISQKYTYIQVRHYSANEGPYSQGHGLPSGHIWLWELDHKEGRTLKNWCLRTVVLEKTFESLLDSKEIKPVNIKGDQPWIFTGGTDAEAEVPLFCPPDENSWLVGKIPDAGRDWGQKEKRASEDGITDAVDMNLDKFQKMVRDRGLECCNPWGRKESDTMGWLNNNSK